jgi:hypothetical protein
VLGFYTHFEATEVCAQPEGQDQAVNVFTILVAEDRSGEEPEPARYLNPKRIRLKSLKGWVFGIERYTRPIAELVPALETLGKSGVWSKSGTFALRQLASFPYRETFSALMTNNKIFRCLTKSGRRPIGSKHNY